MSTVCSRGMERGPWTPCADPHSETRSSAGSVKSASGNSIRMVRGAAWSYVNTLHRSEVLALLAVLLLVGAVEAGDICRGSSPSAEVEKVIHRGAKPKLDAHAGTYKKDVNAGNVLACIMSCCDNLDCDSAFYHKDVCYLINCNVTLPGACDAQTSSDSKFNDTFYINVRTVDYVTPPKKTLTPCEYGVFGECKREHEECQVREGSKSRNGLCRCQSGFQRDEESFDCVPAPTSSATPSTGATSEPSSLSETTPNIIDGGEKKSNKKVTELTVSAGDSKVITLPENTVTLSAFVLPKPKPDEEAYHYEWLLDKFPEGAETGIMEGKNTDTLKLSKLIAGLYRFKIKVTGDNKYGEAVVNVTVEPPARDNQPPVAIIKPKSQVVKTSNSAILDGSDSTDDDKIVSYHWEELIGPLQDHTIQEEALITLSGMAPGNYTFRLTVTDSDGATNSTTANVTFIKETDYPPKANAGSDIVIHLPQSSVTLYGNASTDDREITSYEWIKQADDTLAVDMTGTRTPFLHLNNLEVGDYTFTLKVTDSAQNTATADVHVFVKPEVNSAPVAVTAGEIKVGLPTDNLILDGSNSTDDQKIVSYSWTQEHGQTQLSIQNGDRAVATATGNIVSGEYNFLLTVKDAEGRSSSSKLTITVHKNLNEAPVANAGGDLVVNLPVNMVTIDGSKSYDDYGITSYKWDREGKSLAAGDVLNGSDHQAVLKLVNVVVGRYLFKLTVVDGAGLSSSDTCSVIIKEDVHKEDLLELLLDVDIKHFTQENLESLVKQLQLLLHKSSQHGDVIISIQHLGKDYTTGHVHVVFLVKSQGEDKQVVQSGTEMLRVLKSKLVSESSVLDYKVIRLDTVVCQNNCSGHGHCDRQTKKCICEAFWMQNFFKLYFFQRESNCDWSILYVVIICFTLVVSLAGGTWAIICCLRSKRCRWKSRKRHRYSLLREVDDDEDKTKLELMPKGKIQNSSVMISESDFSSEEETLFINHKKPNGHIQKPLNGISKQHYKGKMKA